MTSWEIVFSQHYFLGAEIMANQYTVRNFTQCRGSIESFYCLAQEKMQQEEQC